MSVRPVLDQLNIVSADPAASLAFYRRLGLEVPDSEVWRTASGPHHVSIRGAGDGDGFDLDLDSTAFAEIWNAGWQGRADLAGRVVLGFRLASREAVDACYADMTAAGYAGLQPPWDAFWGARYAIIADPDGIAVGLASPVSPDRRSAPPAL